MITAVLFDVDGVLRRWDPEEIAAAERDHDLPPGSLRRTAFAEPSLTEAVTGHLTDAQWHADLGARLAADANVPMQRGRAAVAQRSASVGTLDPDVVTLIREQRQLRRVVIAALTLAALPRWRGSRSGPQVGAVTVALAGLSILAVALTLAFRVGLHLPS